VIIPGFYVVNKSAPLAPGSLFIFLCSKHHVPALTSGDFSCRFGAYFWLFSRAIGISTPKRKKPLNTKGFDGLRTTQEGLFQWKPSVCDLIPSTLGNLGCYQLDKAPAFKWVPVMPSGQFYL